jgi:hypothetical protein
MFIKKTKIHIIKKKLNTFNSNEFLLLWFGTLCLLIFFWIIGFKRDYNLAVLLVYISFLVVIFIRDVTFIAELSWSLILFGMNVLGVYVCEETDLYLIEQQLNTKYVNAC